MIGKSLNNKVTGGLRALPSKDVYLTIGVAVLTAALHICGMIVGTGLFQFDEIGTFMSPVVARSHLVIGLSLIINVVGLWSRKATGMLVSMLALMVAGVGYLMWYMYSYWLLNRLKATTFSQIPLEAVPHYPYGLVSSGWWNVAVLVLIVALFVWEVKTLRGILTRSPESN